MDKLYQQMLNELAVESRILAIIGKRGGGKTGTAYKITEDIHTKHPSKPIYALRFPQPKLLPKWIKSIDTPNEAEQGSLVIVDEAAVEYGARDSMKKKNKGLATLLPILRHKDLSILVLTQNTCLSDVNLTRLADMLLFKKPSLLQVKLERNGIRKLLQSAAKKLDNKDKSYSYIILDGKEGTVKTPLPTFWSTKFSKAYSDYTPPETEEEQLIETKPVKKRYTEAELFAIAEQEQSKYLQENKPPTPGEWWDSFTPEQKKKIRWKALAGWYYFIHPVTSRMQGKRTLVVEMPNGEKKVKEL